MLLLELFDNPYPYNIEEGEDEYHAMFRTKNGQEIIMFFVFDILVENELEKIHWDNEAEAYKTLDPLIQQSRNNATLEAWEFSFDALDNTYASVHLPTGKGDQFRVFATVIDFARKVITKEQPEVLWYSGKHPSQKELYERFSKWLQRAGYTVLRGQDPRLGRMWIFVK